MSDLLRTGDDAFTAGLRAYTSSVAAALGVGPESCCLDTAECAAVYVAVDERIAGFPDREVALLWDEETGWSVAVETSGGEALVLVAALDGDLLPEPAEIARWVALVASDGAQPMVVQKHSVDRDELTGRLAHYLADSTGGS
jgi:hypothetical protein